MWKSSFILSIILLTISVTASHACTLYKVTRDGKTIVGNNEDYLTPNHQFWYESGVGDKLGVMYMGQLDNFAQGAINEAGLMFDGFYEPYLAIENTAGKIVIPIADALRKVMQTMSTVEEVQFYLETVNLSSLTESMLVFVDQSGTYLIVEGDVMYKGDEAEKSFSNFYYSQVASVEEVKLDYFQSGRTFLNASQGTSSMDYCGEAMKNFSQSGIAATQYTTIYDLNSLTVRVHLYQDYTQYVEIDLQKELKKGNHRDMIPELFSKDSPGYQHYTKYNDPNHPTLFLEEAIGDSQVSEAEFDAMGFANIISPIAEEWLHQKQAPNSAIKVYTYGLSLMPNNAGLHSDIGEAYFATKNYEQAIIHFEQSLAIEPENNRVKEMLDEIKGK